MKKIFLGLIVLIFLAGVTFFLLNQFGIFTFVQMKEKALAGFEEVPGIGEHLDLKGKSEEYKLTIDKLNEKIIELETSNQSLMTENKAKEYNIIKKEEKIRELEAIYKQKQHKQKSYEAKVKRLADVYSEMEAESSAKILSELEMGLTINILNLVDEGLVAEILSLMDSRLAAQLSLELSE